jgi:hypothetical protein
MAAVSLGMLAWGVAASIYFGATGVRADSAPLYRDVDSVFLVQQDGQWFTVKIDFLMEDRGDGAFEADADTARAEMLARFPNAVPVPEGMEAAYVLSGFKWMAGNTTWKYDSAGAPSSVSAGALGALNAAASTWGGLGANFHFNNGGTSSNGTAACGGSTDGNNTVGWGAQSGSVLAVTCTWFSNSGNPKPAVEFDMQIDPDWNWTTGSPIQVDLQSVTLHEFGHALGLNHSGQSAAVMYASYTSGTNKRTPVQDDIDGELAIYGASGGGATSTPTNTPAQTATATPTRTNTPAPSATTPSGTNTPPGTNTPANTATPTNPASTSTPGGTSTPNATSTPSNTSTPTPTPGTPTATPTMAATATPTGTSGGSNSLPLVPGANLIAWPGSDVSPAQALSGVPNLRIVYAWDPATKSWSRFVPGAPGYVSNISMLKKGLSYWFISSGSGSVPFQP